MSETIIADILTALVIILIVISSSRKKKKRAQNTPQNRSFQSVPVNKSSNFTQRELSQELKNSSGKIHDRGHTHDRLDYDCYTNDSGSIEHYKRQLSSFLSAGIIDRSEYKVLLERYSKSLSGNRRNY